MRNSLLLVLISTLQILAGNSYSQSARLTLDMKNVTIKDVLSQIEKQSNFYFLYDNGLIDVSKKVDLVVQNEQIDVILKKIFGDGEVNAAIRDRHIILTPAGESVSQQSLNVSGKVSDSTGSPLPGVTVVLKGTTKGTITDVNGNYSLTDVPSGAILIFSFVGMKTQEISVGTRTNIKVTMVEESIGIDEVVAVGYGTQKRSLVTGAIATVKAESLENHIVGRADQALMGKLAGVQVQQISGAPGRALNIKVRGTNSINYSSSPLYVVDGYPVDGGLSNVNLGDIESIEVLKDAASAAIYGSRGSNGVVIITTKAGKEGAPELSANVYYGVQKRFSKYDALNRDEWIAFAIEERNNTWALQGGSPDDPNSARPNYSYWIDPVWLSDPQSLPDNDWQDIIDRIAPIQNYQLSASGSNDLVKYYISGTYFNQEGIILNSYFKKLSFQANVETKFSDVVSMGLNFTGTVGQKNDPNTDSNSGGILFSWWTPPVVPIDGNTEEAGFYPYAISILINPYISLRDIKNESRGTYLLSNIYFNVDIAKNLKWRTSFGLERGTSYSQYFIPNNVNRGSGSTGTASTSLGQNYLTESTLKYQLEKSNWVLDLMGGATYQTNTDSDMGLTKSGFPDDQIQTLNVASTLKSGSSTESQWRMMSFIGRINYVLKDRYIFTANLRRDGSSRFGSNKRWGWFPSASTAWRVTEEDFMKDIAWISNLKVRGSYGVVGNNKIGDYSYIGTLGVSNAILGNPENIAIGVNPNSFSNSSLGWEKTATTDVGLELGLLKNRIQLSTGYYVANTRDLLLNLQIPQVTGFANSLQNIGEVQNKGYEFELSTANLNKAFKWNTSFNISFNKNKVLNLGPENAPIYGYLNDLTVTITKVGAPIGSYYMLEQAGVFMNQEDFDNNPHYKQQNVGDIKYLDYDKDGDIDVDDMHIVGSSQPKFIWGMRNSFSYKGFDLSVDIDGQHGNKGLNMARRSGGKSIINEWSRYWDHRWKSPEEPGDGWTPRAVVSANVRTPSTQWLFDATYWCIRNVTFGYNFPKRLSNKIPGVKSLRLYSSVENLYMHDHYFHTPMAANYSNNATTPYADYAASYPTATTYTFGINVKF